jgi:hypothetical protein
MTREELIEQMKALKLENKELISNCNKLNMVHISRLIVIILGAILTIYAIILAYIDYKCYN